MGMVIYDSTLSGRGVADFARIEATSEEDIARQIAEDDEEAAREASVYAALRDKIVVNPVNNINASPQKTAAIQAK